MMFLETYNIDGVLVRRLVSAEDQMTEAAGRFFDVMDYADVRMWLWELLLAAMESDGAAHWGHRYCADQLRYYHHLCDLLQAAAWLQEAMERRLYDWGCSQVTSG